MTETKPYVHPLDRVPATSAPARFEAFAPEISERAFELWASLAGRCATRTLRLLSNELGTGVSLPSASSIRRWAIDGAWHARADADLQQTQGKTLFELQVGWLSGLRLAQKTLLDSMTGALDDLPSSGAGRIKSAEIVLRTIERAGLLAILPKPALDETADEDIDPDERRRRVRDRILEENAGHRHPRA